MAVCKTIVVLGATGSQGGSVIDAFLDDPTWHVRGTTRDSSSPKATALKDRGVEIYQADMNDPTSLAPAFDGAKAIFAVSDFWTVYNGLVASEGADSERALNEVAKEIETKQLKNVIDAASAIPTLERFIFSSMPNIAKLSAGKYTHVYHFDSKADAEEYGRQKHPYLWSKTSVLRPGYFLENFVAHPMGQPRMRADGTVQFTSNLDLELKIPYIAHDEDTGLFVRALVTEPAGKTVVAYREWLTLHEIGKAFSTATGYKTEMTNLPLGQFAFDCPPGLKLEIEESFAFANEYGLEGRNDVGLCHPKDLTSLITLGGVVDWFKKQDWTSILGL